MKYVTSRPKFYRTETTSYSMNWTSETRHRWKNRSAQEIRKKDVTAERSQKKKELSTVKKDIEDRKGGRANFTPLRLYPLYNIWMGGNLFCFFWRGQAKFLEVALKFENINSESNFSLKLDKILEHGLFFRQTFHRTTWSLSRLCPPLAL